MQKISKSKDVYEIIKKDLLGKDVENCIIMTIAPGNVVKSIHWVALGSECQCVIPNKVIARHAIQDLAMGIILIHNHPSGNPKPSREDIEQTEKLRNMLNTLDVLLMDHIIFCDNSYFSFAEEKEVFINA